MTVIKIWLCICRVTRHIWRFVHKALRDCLLIFYDDLSFHALSMVRLAFFDLIVLFTVACYLNFQGRKIDCFTYIIGAITIVAGMYTAKRFTWKQQQEIDSPPQKPPGEGGPNDAN